MQEAYSKDLRERVIRAVAAGRSCRAASAIFGVSVSSAIRWVNRHRTTGETQARRRGGSKPRTLAAHRDWLLARVAQKPDITLRALLAELAMQGVKASYYAVWYFFQREGYSFKKSLYAGEQRRRDVARRRAQWRRYQGRVDPNRLVFIDETWANIKAKLYAMRYARPAPSSSSCRPTAPISIRSSRSSPNSKPSCAKPSQEPSKTRGAALVRCATSSSRENAPITSKTSDTRHNDTITL